MCAAGSRIGRFFFLAFPPRRNVLIRKLGEECRILYTKDNIKSERELRAISFIQVNKHFIRINEIFYNSYNYYYTVWQSGVVITILPSDQNKKFALYIIRSFEIIAKLKQMTRIIFDDKPNLPL